MASSGHECKPAVTNLTRGNKHLMSPYPSMASKLWSILRVEGCRGLRKSQCIRFVSQTSLPDFYFSRGVEISIRKQRERRSCYLGAVGPPPQVQTVVSVARKVMESPQRHPV